MEDFQLTEENDRISVTGDELEISFFFPNEEEGDTFLVNLNHDTITKGNNVYLTDAEDEELAVKAAAQELFKLAASLLAARRKLLEPATALTIKYGTLFASPTTTPSEVSTS